MRTIAVVNQKGGCGKTITAINLSAFLALSGRRVLLVDMDPQGHSTLGLSAGGFEPTRTLYDVLLSDTRRPRTTIADIARPVSENFDLAPSDILLSAVPEALAGIAGRENVLARALVELRGRYDYVIIDCPPNVGLLTFNALKACTEALIPMDPSFFSLHGIGKLFETFDLLEQQAGHRISARVLVTLYPGRTRFVEAVVDEVHRHLTGRYFETMIRQSVKLAEAASHGLPITRYARRSAGFEDYEALAKEIVAQESTMVTADEIRVAAAPVVTPEGVVFTIEAPAAAHVQLAGDFNDWLPERTEMVETGSVWIRTLKLPPGRYRYRYVVDGEWRRDPHNVAAEPSPFGGEDSVLMLGEPQPEVESLSGSEADGA
jgi:chromosome partitioning protein